MSLLLFQVVMSLVPTVHQVYPGSNGTIISGVPVNANGGFIGIRIMSISLSLYYCFVLISFIVSLLFFRC